MLVKPGGGVIKELGFGYYPKQNNQAKKMQTRTERGARFQPHKKGVILRLSSLSYLRKLKHSDDGILYIKSEPAHRRGGGNSGYIQLRTPEEEKGTVNPKK